MYSPTLGRFMQTDPVGYDGGINIYEYADDDPVDHDDPSGQDPVAYLPTWEQWKAVGSFVESGVEEDVNSVIRVSSANGTASFGDYVNTAAVVASALLPGASEGSAAVAPLEKASVETLQRAMSRAELRATESSGLLRGGRPGTHFASDAVNSSARRAQQRLALPGKPQVRVTFDVSKGIFSKPNRVAGANGMPGGGMERTATGSVPIKIRKVDQMP
jgi:hypothetical protein